MSIKSKMKSQSQSKKIQKWKLSANQRKEKLFKTKGRTKSKKREIWRKKHHRQSILQDYVKLLLFIKDKKFQRWRQTELCFLSIKDKFKNSCCVAAKDKKTKSNWQDERQKKKTQMTKTMTKTKTETMTNKKTNSSWRVAKNERKAFVIDQAEDLNGTIVNVDSSNTIKREMYIWSNRREVKKN